MRRRGCRTLRWRPYGPAWPCQGGRILAISTPSGRRGWLFDAWESEEDWLRIAVPAWEIPRISEAWLESEKLALGPLFDQEYGCRFVQSELQYFSAETVAKIFKKPGFEPTQEDP